MFLLRLQAHQLQKLMLESGFHLSEFTFRNNDADYAIHHAETDSQFMIRSQQSGTHPIGCKFSPDLSSAHSPKRSGGASFKNWEETVQFFQRWLPWAKEEIDAPDLWAEAVKTAQLFTGTTSAPDDKFTRTELAEVQGQLRQLQQSFAAAALSEAARQKLIELTATAAVKAESLTKKDWQQMIIGGFVQAIIGLALNPTQAQEVLKLVKAAFGGLFLH